MDASVQPMDGSYPTPAGHRTSRSTFYAGVVVVGCAVALGVATYLILTGQTRFDPTEQVVYGLLAGNAALVGAMLLMIGWQIVGIWRGRRRGSAGARLHVRLITMFALVAVLPAILVAVFASVTLDRGLDSWFSERTRAIIDNAQLVAESYLIEHGRNIRADATAMVNDMNRAKLVYDREPNRYAQLLGNQAALRSLSAGFVITRDGTVLVRARSRRDIVYSPPPSGAYDGADSGSVIVFRPDRDNMVRALAKLPDFDDAYVYLFRSVDPKVVQHLRETQERRTEYNQIELRRADVQITFGLLYIGMSLIFLLASIWFGIWVADRLVKPIGQLINAARRVSLGDLGVEVSIANREGDLAALGRTFNDMTTDLRSQREELEATNATLDSRRRFTEAVLTGVTAGVVGLDRDGKVELVNRAAQTLLQRSEESLIGQELFVEVPSFAHLIQEAGERQNRLAQADVTLTVSGRERNLHVRVTSEKADGAEEGYVVTFDDVTDLVNAQRSSAWADIARRIAHEIKNPLTPIQLSAERLKRKYGKHIETDRAVFEQCTDTIIRQVGDIGKMVDEFSSFARMPKATMEAHDLHEVVRDAVVLQKVAFPELDFVISVPDEPLRAMIDRRLITQGITNLVKNASEAIDGVEEWGEDERGSIEVAISHAAAMVTIDVIDNGKGLPDEGRQRLVEPYMTTREKGTGLGLAIVAKIMDEHGGRLTLEDSPKVAEGGRGAMVRLEFPLHEPIETLVADDDPDEVAHVLNEAEKSAIDGV